jgi:hypothetical protein
MIGVFVGFSRIFLLGILIFKGLTARPLCKLFGVKGLSVFTSLLFTDLLDNRHLCISKLSITSWF